MSDGPVLSELRAMRREQTENFATVLEAIVSLSTKTDTILQIAKRNTQAIQFLRGQTPDPKEDLLEG